MATTRNQGNSGNRKQQGKKKNKMVILIIEVLLLVVMLVVLGVLLWSKDKVEVAPKFDDFDIDMNPIVKGIEVNVSDLVGIEVIARNVELADGTILIKAGETLDSEKIQLLIDNGVTTVYVESLSSTAMIDKKYWNIAIFGVDSREANLGTGTLSDVIMIASINTESGEVKLVSVFRDTYLMIGEGSYEKATHAYSKGGASRSMGMLNVNLDLNITDFITVGFEGLTDVVDALGGIPMNIDSQELEHINNYQISMVESMGLSGYTEVTTTGYQTLNGLQATALCRIRYKNGGDYARAATQREVIEAIAEKAKTADAVTLTKIANSLLPLVYTSLDLEEILSLLKDINKYEIVADEGFPLEQYRAAGRVGSKGDIVVPATLEKNVIWLHSYLFNEEDYQVSEQVKEYSQKIYDDTQSYLGY